MKRSSAPRALRAAPVRRQDRRRLRRLDRIAVKALRAADRPRGGNPLVIALELGFEMLPCSPDSSPELARTTSSRIAFAAKGDPAEHAARVMLALARGLLLRTRRPHTPRDVAYLAARLTALHAPPPPACPARLVPPVDEAPAPVAYPSAA